MTNAAHLDVKLDAALKQVRTLLENTRQPLYAADVPHAYDDKFELAEFLVRSGVAAVLQCLTNIGVTQEGLATMRGWAKTRTVTLRLRAEETCTFLREETRKEESPRARVTEIATRSGTTSVTETVVTTVTEYFWSLDFKWELFAFQGSAESPAVEIASRASSIEMKTAVKTPPRPQTAIRPPIDIDVSWLLRQLDDEGRVAFAIDRTSDACHTPRRNRQVEAALTATADLGGWCRRVPAYFMSELFPAQALEGLDLGALREDGIFVPLLPIFESTPGAESLLPSAYVTAFLEEQRRSLAAKGDELARVFLPDAPALSALEARIVVTLLHAARVCASLWQGADFIEKMLRDQLVAAIGKELSPADFTEYMDFHFRKLVKAEVHPRPFSYAVRRADRSPEGVLSLMLDGEAGETAEPISTSVAWAAAARAMEFPLDASTRVKFLGDRYLHAWVAHQFSGAVDVSLEIVARARQFSSFILLVGRISSIDAFEPKAAVIVENKDLLKIPIMLEQIPTPKEFRDAIESLSPEQQRFAKALREMQLESTLFGVVVIQIKPQLEKVLKLPPDSLTKEIKLTQELLNLFIEYQIPSDLLSYDGDESAPTDEKLSRVRDYVARMDEMIHLSKKRELEEEEERRAYAADTNRPHAYPAGPWNAPPGGGFGPPAMAGMMMPSAAPGFGAPPPPPPPAPFAPGPPAAMPMQRAERGGPPPQPQQQVMQERAQVDAPRQPQRAGGAASSGATDTGPVVDYTRIPKELDEKLDLLDEDSALRPTILNLGKVWSRERRPSLLSGPIESNLLAKEQEEERSKAFDLLDALSKSGALTIDDASLHVVIAATHGFDKTLLDTVIQGNVNPIEKVERSLMIMASTIHRRPVVELIEGDQRDRFLTFSPKLGA